jgi:hypothetical protein
MVSVLCDLRDGWELACNPDVYSNTWLQKRGVRGKTKEVHRATLMALRWRRLIQLHDSDFTDAGHPIQTYRLTGKGVDVAARLKQ